MASQKVLKCELDDKPYILHYVLAKKKKISMPPIDI